MIGHLCKCCKEKQEIKYTNVDDINNLINQFSANITKKWGQDLLRQEIYDLYHDRIKDELITRLEFITPKKAIEELLGTHFEEEIDDSLDQNNGFDYIYETYIPKITDKFDLFDDSDVGHLEQSIGETFMGKLWEMIHEVYLELVPIFVNRIENKLI